MAWEIRDVTPGLWLWRVEHPDWSPEAGWELMVNSTCVESGREVALLDPLAPPEDATEVWERLDSNPPTLVVVLKPDHVRDVDLFVRRYGARLRPTPLLARQHPRDGARGNRARQRASWRARGTARRPRTERDAALAARAARSRLADGLTAQEGGELRVWATPWHEERVLPALRKLLDLPFEHVVVAHGEPAHDRAAYKRALELPPWGD